jgi:hypothetical protein
MDSVDSIQQFIRGIILMMFSAFALGLAVGTTITSNDYIMMALLSICVILTIVSLRMIKDHANNLTLKV